MGVWTLRGTLDSDEEAAVMIDSTGGEALPLVFRGPHAADDIDAFLTWLREKHGMDPRQLDQPGQLRDARSRWLADVAKEAQADSDADDLGSADTEPASAIVARAL